MAGLFYPRRKRTLQKTIKQLLDEVSRPPLPELHGLIVPHAGYKYSGPVAASAYAQLTGRDFRTVIVMAPSHYADFQGASIATEDAFATPLGTIPLAPLADKLSHKHPFVRGPSCRAVRPDWWRQSSRTALAPEDDTPHTWEHSLEVQLPFLQETLQDFSIVPIIFGNVDPQAVAQALAPHIDDKTLVVASSDLSHKLPYAEAKRLDAVAVRAICNLDIEQMAHQDACGRGPILTLMYLAKINGWHPELLDYRNSGDTQGDKSSVVGYAAVAFSRPNESKEQPQNMDKPATHSGDESPQADEPSQADIYTKADRAFMLDLARRTIEDVVKKRKLPRPDSAQIPQKLQHRRACFVTLRIDGALRGCIGNILPEEPLYKAVIHMANRAATHDTRFQPVTADEVDKLHIEISVLSVPQPLEFSSPEDLLDKLRPDIDGVVLKLGLRQSTFLPQVWEHLSDKREFLTRLCEKAKLSPMDWRNPKLKIETYQVEAFEEQ